METRDWSLVFFTVLTQAAVGAFLVLQVLQSRSLRGGTANRETAQPRDADSGTAQPRDADPGTAQPRDADPETAQPQDADPETAAPLLVVLAVLSAGLFAALFHLSTPLQAARAVVNFSTSWLSREIVFGGLFATLLSALVWREWRGAGSASAHPVQERHAARSAPADAEPARPPSGPAAVNPAAEPSAAGPAAVNPATPHPVPATWLPRLAAAAGLAFLGCQTAIYLLPAQPAWNSLATPAAFGGTALRLGILGVVAGLVVWRPAPDAPDAAARRGQPARTARRGPTPATLRRLALAGIAALALEFVVVPLHLASLAADPRPAAAASAERLTDVYGDVLLLRLGLLAVAAAALGGVLALDRGPSRPARRGPARGETPRRPETAEAPARAGTVRAVTRHEQPGSDAAPRRAAPVVGEDRLRQRLRPVLACGALGLVALSEVCGRFLFYAMQVRVGI